jgi:chemotaxis protein methyltransferase CheR
MCAADRSGVGMTKPRLTKTRFALADHEFIAVRDHLANSAGLLFDESRRPSLASVVAERLRATGAPDVGAYLASLSGPDGAAEAQQLIDGVTVQETQFFRNPPQMDALREHVLPELLRQCIGRTRPLTVWSAGCSTGEEAYTLAMLLLDLMPTGSAGRARILATDISAEALRTAAEATYSGRTLDTLPADDRARWFEPGPGEALVVGEQARGLVELRQHNLVADAAPFKAGEVDLVVCRNVTIYFARATTRALMGRFHGVLADGGYLLLGHSETLWQVSDAFALVPVGGAFVYRRVEPSVPAAITAPTVRRAPSAATSRPLMPNRDQPADDQLTAARTALAAGDYREAAVQAETAVASDSLLAEAYVVLGHARSTMGLDAEAADSLRKAVYLDPLAGHAHFLLAGVLARLGQHSAAAASYRAAAQALPSVPASVLAAYLVDRKVSELVAVCVRLAAASTELAADAEPLAYGRNAS